MELNQVLGMLTANKRQLADIANNARFKTEKIEQTDCSTALQAQIAGTAGLLSVPQDASVTRYKYDKAIKSINLFDKTKIKANTYLSDTGVETTSETRSLSDYIPVKANTTYTLKRVRDVAFYNANKVFISPLIKNATFQTNLQVTTSSDTAFIRYTTSPVQAYLDAEMCVEGTTMPDYVPFTFELPDLRIGINNLKNEPELDLHEGKSFINSFYGSDFTFVGNELWGFARSDDDDNIGQIKIISEHTKALKKTLNHNFGHCNTIDYCEETDALIFGNGSGYYDTDGYIYIIQGVKAWTDLAEGTMLDMTAGISGSVITTISVARLFGDKVNVCWGEDNNDQYNICYVLSNDNQNIRKLLLGMGTNQFENGQYVAGRTASQFNGTYKILNEWTTTKISVNQGCDYYNGAIYSGLGHDHKWVVKYKLDSVNNTITTEQIHEYFYSPDGTKLADVVTEGLTIRNGMIYHRVIGDVNAIYKYRAF